MISETETPKETTEAVAPPVEQTSTTETATTTTSEPLTTEEFVPLTAEALKIPEGITVDEAMRDKFLTFANEQKFTPEQANSLVAMQGELMAQVAEQQNKTILDLHEGWLDTMKKDPEIGGKALESNLAAISTLLNTYGEGPKGELTREAFDMTGAGNHPELVRFLSRIAKKLNEPGTIAPGKADLPKPSLAERMFPSMKGNN